MMYVVLAAQAMTAQRLGVATPQTRKSMQPDQLQHEQDVIRDSLAGQVDVWSQTQMQSMQCEPYQT